jgi:hypothetical protein
MFERMQARRPVARAPRVAGAPHGDAGATAAVPARHDLSRISVSAPGAAPVQRVRWRWDAANDQWSGPPGASHARQPPHAGRRDGEAFEDNR